MYWNYGAKNLGIIESKTPWVFLSELDHIVDPDSARKILQIQVEPKNYYMFMRKNFHQSSNKRYSDRPHVATFLFNKNDYQNAGGIDEDFSGHYGYDDLFFRDCLHYTGCNCVLEQDIVLKNISGNFESKDADLSEDKSVPRDTCRNKLLYEQKLKTMDVSREKLRFNWREI